MKKCSNGYHMKGTTEYPKKVHEIAARGKDQEKERSKEQNQDASPPPCSWQ